MKRRMWKPDAPVAENVRKRLPKMARKYLARGARALEEESSWDDIHDFRLATKRFRYALEMFAPLYGPGLEARLEDLRKIQTMLGDANDCVVTAEMLGDDEAANAARERLQEKAEAKTRKLRAWWRTAFHAPAAAERWAAYLARPKKAAR